MAKNPAMVNIPPTQQFKLPNPYSANNTLIRRVCVVKTIGSIITVRPIKIKSVVQPSQDIDISLFLINRISKRGTIIYFDKEGMATRFTPAPEVLVETLVRRYE